MHRGARSSARSTRKSYATSRRFEPSRRSRMSPRFRRGGTVYAKDGRSYVVEAVEDGMVYCTQSNGAETEFPESALLNETEWAARSDGRRDVSYSRLKQSRI